MKKEVYSNFWPVLYIHNIIISIIFLLYRLYFYYIHDIFIISIIFILYPFLYFFMQLSFQCGNAKGRSQISCLMMEPDMNQVCQEILGTPLVEICPLLQQLQQQQQ